MVYTLSTSIPLTRKDGLTIKLFFELYLSPMCEPMRATIRQLRSQHFTSEFRKWSVTKFLFFQLKEHEECLLCTWHIQPVPALAVTMLWRIFVFVLNDWCISWRYIKYKLQKHLDHFPWLRNGEWADSDVLGLGFVRAAIFASKLLMTQTMVTFQEGC